MSKVPKLDAFSQRVVDCANACKGIDDPSSIPDLLTACSNLVNLIQAGNPDPQQLTQLAQIAQAPLKKLMPPPPPPPPPPANDPDPNQIQV